MQKLILPLLIFFTFSAFSQPGLKTKDIFNKELTYNFGSLIMVINFSSDSTLYWKQGAAGQITHEKSSSFMLNDHSMITRWYGTEEIWFSIFSDFETGNASLTKGTEAIVKGTISLKK